MNIQILHRYFIPCILYGMHKKIILSSKKVWFGNGYINWIYMKGVCSILSYQLPIIAQCSNKITAFYIYHKSILFLGCNVTKFLINSKTYLLVSTVIDCVVDTFLNIYLSIEHSLFCTYLLTKVQIYSALETTTVAISIII